jgi:NADH-quinone oxidoreductase subunit J
MVGKPPVSFEKLFLELISMLLPKLLFLFLAILATFTGLNVLWQRSPLYSAFSLVGLFACLAAIYIMLQAQFIGAIQVIVYAGAIMVLFVFVIMLLNIREEKRRPDEYQYLYLFVPLLGVGLLGEVLWCLSKLPEISEKALQANNIAIVGDSKSIGMGLFSQYLLPFELASILILMAIVGSVVLARKDDAKDDAKSDAVTPAATSSTNAE